MKKIKKNCCRKTALMLFEEIMFDFCGCERCKRFKKLKKKLL